jgi:hypothetical protein
MLQFPIDLQPLDQLHDLPARADLPEVTSRLATNARQLWAGKGPLKGYTLLLGKPQDARERVLFAQFFT